MSAHRAERGEERRTLVTFDIAGQEFAIDLEAVREILPLADTVAPMPRSEAMVLGVTSYRGTLLPLLSLRVILGFTPIPAAGQEKVLVARIGGVLAGLVVDRMRAILPADTALIDPTPPVLAARAGGEARITAIYRGDGGKRLVSILAPDQLFREDVMRQLTSEIEAHAGAGTGASDVQGNDERSFVVFRLGEDEFGLPVEAVDEVADVPTSITRVPRAPKFLEGVVNLRGEVLPVVDQRRRFEMPPLAAGARRRLMVVRSERRRAGLIVDRVTEVLRSPAAAIDAAPELTEDMSRLISGVIRRHGSGDIVLILDAGELLSRAERDLLDKWEAKAATAAR